MDLKEQLAEAIANGKRAVEAGDLAKAKEWKEKVAVLKESIELAKAFEVPASSDPVRPPLPGAGEGPLGKEPESRQDNPAVSPLLKSVYVRRFGSPDETVEAILRDLHGADYMQKYFDHKKAFFRYCRYGDSALNADQRRLLHDIIFTPAAIKAAYEQGVDDVQLLKSTMVEGADTLGGYVVPVDFQAEIISRLNALTIVRQRATVRTTSRDSVEYPKVTGGDSQYRSAVRVTWVSETPSSSAAETNLTYGMERIPIHTVMATTPVSMNLLEDAAYPIEQDLAQQFGDALAINEDNCFLTGDGNAKPEGILPGSSNGLGLSYGYNPSSSTAVEWDGLIDTMYALDAQYRQNAVWIAEKATYEAIAKLKDSDGQYLWRERYGDNATEGFHQRLMGFPALEQEAMPSIASGAFVMIFGDLRGYRIVDRVGMSVRRYEDSTTAATNTVKFVMRRRLGGQVIEPWRFVLYKIATS